MGLGRVHVVTDCRTGCDPVGLVRAVLAAGPDDLVVQFRAADGWTDRHTLALAEEITALCRTAGVTVLVNDRVDIALAVGADGVHVGADDLPVAVARRLLGPGAIVGATARTGESGLRAVADGADYLGVGPAYVTSTKDGLPDAIGPAGVGAVARACAGTPVVAIAGVTVARVPELLAAGAHGVAVIGAVSQATDPAAVVRQLRRAVSGIEG